MDRSRRVVKRLTGGVRGLLSKNSVEQIAGTGVVTSSNAVEVDSRLTLTTDNIVIATGARERELPAVPVDGQRIITSREALELRSLPSRVVIVGGGAIGAEFAFLYRAYGAEVTIVELLPRLIPQEDEDLGRSLEMSFKRQGIQAVTGARVTAVSVEDGRVRVSVSKDGGGSVVECDRVLVAVGIQGNVEGIGLDRVGVETRDGFISTDGNMETSVPGIYAVGDVTGKMPLAHVASAQGVIAAESIAGLDPPALDYALMPRAIYCEPQVAALGLTEAQAREAGHSVKTGRFPLAASGKALAVDESDGMVKLVIDSEIGEILGAHMIGPGVSELLGELALVKTLEGTTTELGWLVHPHPTISETLKEAALAAEGQAIHI